MCAVYLATDTLATGTKYWTYSPVWINTVAADSPPGCGARDVKGHEFNCSCSEDNGYYDVITSVTSHVVSHSIIGCFDWFSTQIFHST